MIAPTMALTAKAVRTTTASAKATPTPTATLISQIPSTTRTTAATTTTITTKGKTPYHQALTGYFLFVYLPTDSKQC